MSAAEPGWLHAHAHEPNLEIPPGDGEFQFIDGANSRWVSADDLRGLPSTELAGCHIVSTGHAPSGPFCFGGVTLGDLLAAFAPGAAPAAVDVESADGFGTRLLPHEWARGAARPPLLAWVIDGAPLTRAQGLVRLIVPTETTDALRQVKWVARLTLRYGDRLSHRLP